MSQPQGRLLCVQTTACPVWCPEGSHSGVGCAFLRGLWQYQGDFSQAIEDYNLALSKDKGAVLASPGTVRSQGLQRKVRA